jgi:hypothetical protein
VSETIQLDRAIAGKAVLVVDAPHARRADAPFQIRCP